ncbi:MAG: secondary thiamine-phosphate synthase enzyme YjbQ [Candidatus Thorarchaeota archaeon]
MSTHHENISFQTRGDCDMIDITHLVEKAVGKSEMKTGICTVFCTGSTGSITTIEYEDGLLKDFPVAMERVAPKDALYEHHLRWHDGNGHSHIRASILGPSLTIPFVNGKLTLGTWQQITFVDFDNKPRSRRLEIVIIGE